METQIIMYIYIDFFCVTTGIILWTVSHKKYPDVRKHVAAVADV